MHFKIIRNDSNAQREVRDKILTSGDFISRDRVVSSMIYRASLGQQQFI